MATRARAQALYWGIAAAVFLAVLWLLGDILLPFILGGAVAYLLDPVADRLERLGLPRALAVALITLVAVLVFIAVVIPAALTLAQQAAGLVRAAPELLRSLEGGLTGRFPQLIEYELQISGALGGLGEAIRARGAAIAAGIVTAGLGVLGGILLLVIVPVVAFYLLLDWDRMVAQIDSLLPREHAPTIRRLMREVDETLSSFVRGQGTVMLILGTYYAVALMLAGLNFGLVVGALAGLVTFIPYVGAIFGGGLALGLALFQYWGPDGLQWVPVLIIAAIFVSGQMIEGNVLTPLLVGGSVGLHPVWLLFALSAFGAMFGFIGLLVAVPVAAALGVIARFGVERYQASALYTGTEPAAPPPPGAP